MNERFIATTSAPESDSPGGNMYVPKDVHEALGGSETIAWFMDEDSGFIYVVPASEVSLQ